MWPDATFCRLVSREQIWQSPKSAKQQAGRYPGQIVLAPNGIATCKIAHEPPLMHTTQLGARSRRLRGWSWLHGNVWHVRPRRRERKHRRRFTRRSMRESICSTLAIFTAWATMKCSSAGRLKGRRDKVLLSVKIGAMRAPGGAWIGIDGRPKAVKNFAAYSLQRLKTDRIDVYRLARLDPEVPIEDSIGAIAELVKAGQVRYIGLSEVVLRPYGGRTPRIPSAICKSNMLW